MKFSTMPYVPVYPTHLCRNCGKPIAFHVWDTVWLHDELERWVGDNGYWCFEGDYVRSASPITELDMA